VTKNDHGVLAYRLAYHWRPHCVGGHQPTPIESSVIYVVSEAAVLTPLVVKDNGMLKLK
jgi:hypothetical protein